jgi:hypothetical protein
MMISPKERSPTVCVTGAGAGVDGAKAPQKKLKARKLLVNRADSQKSAARCVRRAFLLEDT